MDGKQINLGSDRQAAFEEYARLIAAPKEMRVAPAHSLPAVIDAFLSWVKPRRAPDTFEWYRYRLERLARKYPDLSAAALTIELVEEWVDGINLSVTSRCNYYRSIKKCMSWARKRVLIKRNRIRDLEVPNAESREVVISPEEYQRLTDLIRDQTFRDLVVVTWESEVADLGFAASRQEDVGRLQITMDDLTSMGMLERECQLLDQFGGRFRRVGCGLKPLSQRPLVGKLQRDPGCPLMFADLIDLDEIGVREPRDGFRFRANSCEFPQRQSSLRMKCLDRHSASQSPVASQVDDSHAATPELTLNDVVSDRHRTHLTGRERLGP